jgi:VCBS repeat-containing protein
MDGSDLAASTYTGSFPGDTGETDAINQLTAAGGTGPYTYELVGSPTGSYGVIQINADGSYIYTLTKPYDTTPDADNGMNTEENKESFTYKVTDANGNTAQGTITVDIVDDIPTAHPQEYSIEVETPVTTAQIGALAAGWVAPFDSNVDNQYNTDADIYAEKIAWGDSSSSSSYVYNDNNALANVNIGEKFTLGTFTHNNFPIPSGSSITAANLRVTFDVVINGQTVHVDHTIQFQHNETPNDGANSDDIVTIINGTNVVNITVGDATYQLTIGFQDAAGNTVTQVYTDENESTSFNLNGTLALVSMVSTPDVVGTVDADFGADGPAALPIVSIAHDFDGDGTVEVYNTSSTGYNVGTTTLTLTTHEGGTFTMNFSTGDYTYTAPTNPLLGSDEIFEYTIIDADGDTATSTLTFNLPVENMLVVGTNVDDQAGQTVDHYIDNVAPFDGPITGGAGNDILVGDIGGANSVVQPGHNYNISLIVDSSGSMDKASGTAGYTRMELAKEALKNLANQLVDHDGIINLQIIDFDSNVVANISWSNITSDNLSAIYKAIDDMVAGGATNYEAGFDSARNWLSSQTNGYENITFFLTDGNPTYYLNSSGNVAGPGNVTDYSTMLNSVQAFALLSPLSSVEAIGIGSDVNENYLKFFDNTDVTGTGSVSFWNGTVRGPVGEVEIVNTSEELSAALQHGSSEYTLLEAGDDHLIGGDSDDIIFGDSVNTDALADANALSTPDGAGWAVFQQLGWSEQQIMDYIKTNHLSLSAESGRTGGNDIIDGGAGDDIIYGQEGNDILSGGTGNNILSGGSGADTFVISSGAHDTILDYSKADGDKVDISSVLDEGAGDHLNVIANADGSVKLEILDSSNVEKASISFETINYSDLNDMGAGNELDSLLNKVVIDH